MSAYLTVLVAAGCGAAGAPSGGKPAGRDTGTIGAVFAKAEGPTAAYRFRGDELYVRAKIVSTRPQANAIREGQVQVAWTPPIVPRARSGNP